MARFLDKIKIRYHKRGKEHVNEKRVDQQKLGDRKYVLRRDYSGSSRLNLQYYLWKSTLQYSIHPSIPQPRNSARVADIATGTAIWLLDLSESVTTSVQLDGFDISPAQYPPTPWLPKNVNLETWDMYTDPPARLHGQYDIVHVRLIMLAIIDGNPLPIIRNLRKLLKPGGFLQWEEVDRVNSHVEKAYHDKNIQATAIEKLFLVNQDRNRASDSWQTRLVSDLDANGFTESTLYTYNAKPTIARYFNDMYMTAFDEVMMKLVSADGREQFENNIAMAVDEVQEGAVIAFPMLVWVAKAL